MIASVGFNDENENDKAPLAEDNAGLSKRDGRERNPHGIREMDPFGHHTITEVTPINIIYLNDDETGASAAAVLVESLEWNYT